MKKLSKTDVSLVHNFLAQLSKFGVWVAGWGLAIDSNLFWDFPEII